MKKQIILTILLVTLALPTILSHTGNDEFDHCSGFCPMMSGQYGYGGMLFGWLFSILVLVAIMLLIIWLIKQIQSKK